MFATNKIQTSSQRLIAIAILGAVSMFASGCQHVFFRESRPTIEALMMESLEASAKQTANEGTFDYVNDQSLLPRLVENYIENETAALEELPLPDDSDEIRIDQEFIETDIREALFFISDDAGLEFILDDEVSGVVNTSISGLTVSQALDKVLSPLGYVYLRKDERIYIGTADPTSALFEYVSEEYRFRPQHLTPQELVDSLPTRWKRFAQVVDKLNLVLIEAPPKDGRAIVARFKELDQEIPQVVLEVMVVVVAPDSGIRFGVDWNHAVEISETEIVKLASTGLALSAGLTHGTNQLFTDVGSTTAFVKSLEENGYLTIRAAPRVMAQDGEKANITIGRETYFSLSQSNSNNNNNPFIVQNDIQTVESGILLEFTPRIRGDRVTLEIERAEVSEDVRTANTDTALNPFPVINRRTVSTTVHVPDGRTIAIGGLVQRQVVDRVNGVVGLSKLPGIGRIFESIERQEQDAEVVILISPRIVSQRTDVTAVSPPYSSH